MLRKRGLYALKALLELAQQPQAWQSVNQLAKAQRLPAPMLEQLLLQLRRADLVEARRGRSGGYRLRRPAQETRLAEILSAVDVGPQLDASIGGTIDTVLGEEEVEEAGKAGDRVVSALQRRLQRALEKELDALSLEELLFDLRSWQESLREDGGLMVG
jgi:Rrf2 family iron-sulfur cluster assembly transcriptional regulator